MFRYSKRFSNKWAQYIFNKKYILPEWMCLAVAQIVEEESHVENSIDHRDGAPADDDRLAEASD